MNLSDHRNLPGPGDACTWGAPMGHPMDPRTDVDALDELEPDRDQMIASEADAILAGCETLDGALEFAKTWNDCNGAPPGLSALVLMASVVNDVNLIGAALLRTLRAEAMRQASERVTE